MVLRGAHLHLRQELDTLRAVRVDLSHVRGLCSVACGKDKVSVSVASRFEARATIKEGRT